MDLKLEATGLMFLKLEAFLLAARGERCSCKNLPAEGDMFFEVFRKRIVQFA